MHTYGFSFLAPKEDLCEAMEMELVMDNETGWRLVESKLPQWLQEAGVFEITQALAEAAGPTPLVGNDLTAAELSVTTRRQLRTSRVRCPTALPDG